MVRRAWGTRIFAPPIRPSSVSIRSSHVAFSTHLAQAARLGAVISSLACAVGCGQGAGVSGGPDIAYDACAPLALMSDPGSTDTAAAGIAGAIALWNAKAGTHLMLPGGPGATGAAGLPIHFQAAAAPFHGLYDAPRGQVFINTDLSGAPLTITITHEIGHAFGLVHVPPDQRSSVMNPNNLNVEPTAEDVDTLANRWGVCGASDHPPSP
jgi:hypothetical protein